jgi:ABC-type nitrate/sulfonate/bicarbonate transport system permease component
MKWIIGILIGTSIGIVIGFSVYHYFFMDKFSCCGIFG